MFCTSCRVDLRYVCVCVRVHVGVCLAGGSERGGVRDPETL